MFHPLRIEYDAAIPMRDGAELSANVFRPEAEGQFPVIMTLGPYPKDIHFKDWDRLGFYARVAEHGPHMHWETVNPEWWVPQGYVVIRIDTRGTSKSKGRPSLLSMREAEDFHDAIEWAGVQPAQASRNTTPRTARKRACASRPSRSSSRSSSPGRSSSRCGSRARRATPI